MKSRRIKVSVDPRWFKHILTNAWLYRDEQQTLLTPEDMKDYHFPVMREIARLEDSLYDVEHRDKVKLQKMIESFYKLYGKHVCRTPGAQYHTSFTSNKVKVDVDLPTETKFPEWMTEEHIEAFYERLDNKLHVAIENVLRELF